VNIASFVAGQLALFAWREGERLSPGCPEVKLGIAHVIANRVSAGWEGGGDWLKILANAPVHSANNVSEMDFTSYVDVWRPEFRSLFANCEKIYAGELRDEITTSADPRKAGGIGRPQPALFYGSLQILTRQWFVEKIVHCPEGHPRTADAGAVTFWG